MQLSRVLETNSIAADLESTLLHKRFAAMTDETKELSKNELKKMAKKAEKSAKKQQATGGPGGQPAKEPTNVPSSTSETAGLTTSAPLPLTLVNATVKDSAALKAVWAAQRFQVTLEGSTKVPSDSFFGDRHAVLTYGDVVVGGGGNAMAQAIACLSKENKLAPHLVDEWTEWERTVLRPSLVDATALAAALGYLDAALHGHLHLITGSKGDSVADICIAVSLHELKEGTLEAYPNVFRYVKAHTQSLQQAQVSLQQIILQSSKPSFDVQSALKEPRLLSVVNSIFLEAIYGLFGDDIGLPRRICKECTNLKDGDYQCSAAMPVFSALKKRSSTEYQSPQQVAQAIMNSLGSDHPILSDIVPFGNGFILCRVSAQFLQKHINQWILTDNPSVPYYKFEEPAPVCVVDFSSPNIAKEMHVGHLRSTIIGESICRILERAGATVHRINHTGDWGTQFGMLIQYLREEYPEVSNSDADGKELPNISDLTAFYKQAKQRFDDDADFKEQSRLNVVALQSGDSECRKVWKMLCDVSRLEFEKVYRRLDVTVEEFGESFYNDKIPPVIEEFEKAGKISVEEGGAKCVFVPNFKVPLMLQKSDGGYGYDSTDMAALKYRLKVLNADRVIYITDFSQGDHFKMVFAAGHAIGWVDKGQRLEHIGFGTVMGEDGKRFKTRSGETVRLVDLLDEAVNRMESSLRERIAEGKANITEGEVHEVAEAIGYGAVKYFDLRRNPTSNYEFSYDQMLATKGETAVYLLYARVRLESIIAKAATEFNVNVEDLVRDKQAVEIGHPTERNLALQLQKYADAMDQVLEDLYPYHVCEYVYKLAIAASDFVTQCKVLGSPEMNSRLLLCLATTIAMKQSFDLLGIRHVKRI